MGTSEARPTIPELVSALLLNGTDACFKAGRRLAREAATFMVVHVNHYATLGGVSVGERTEGQLIDRVLFQQAWALLQAKQESSPEDALAAVGVGRHNATRFMEDPKIWVRHAHKFAVHKLPAGV